MSKEIKWIKLVPDWFNDSKIKQLKTMPERYALTTIWFCLLGLAGISNNYGKLTLGNIPYDEKMLSNEFDIPEHLIQLALNVFKKLGMIEILDEENCLYITNWEKHQNLEGMEKLKIQWKEASKRYRENKKLEHHKASYDGTYDVIEQNKNKNIDIDKDKDKEVFNNKSINNKKNIGIKRHIVGHSPDAASQGILNPELLPVKITIYDEIINYLNQKCGSKYKSNTPATMSAIKSRIKEGFKLDDFKEVIDKKTEEWINNPKMCLYLRPTTLFGTKFESYLNQKIINKNASQRTIKNFIVNQEVKKDIEGGIL
jgi:uncharacterized phage protein (TIGR02220 family)/predicted phage replisome organizer